MPMNLTPKSEFLKGRKIPAADDLKALSFAFGFEKIEDVDLIDTSHDIDDVRLNYIVDKKFVLRVCNAPDMSEKRMEELNRLIERYKEVGVQSPKFLKNRNGYYFEKWGEYVAYVSEYIDLPLAEDAKLEDEDALEAEIEKFVARFARRYKDCDLIDTMSMYSLFDLSPFDKQNGVDEKQDNFNHLVAFLVELGEDKLADKLTARNQAVREELKKVYKSLPHCVFQADENFSNVLVDENGRLAGLIDFNLAGTDVIVNHFANLSGFHYSLMDWTKKTPKEVLDESLKYYRRHMSNVLSEYDATTEELAAMKKYAWIVSVSGWPYHCFFLDALKNPNLKAKTLELLDLLADADENIFLDINYGKSATCSA